MYRLSSDLAPYATHPDMPQFHGMVRESAAELKAIGDKAKRLDIRLSFHPSQFVVLNSPDPELIEKSIWDLASQAEMLDLMELGPEAVLVIHVGGTYGDRQSSAARWVETWKILPEHVRRRLVLEHDDLRFSAADVLWIHEQTGVRLIFDYQHFWCLNPEGLDMRETLRRSCGHGRTASAPKIHFSSPRTELRQVKRTDRKTAQEHRRERRPGLDRARRFLQPVRVRHIHADGGGSGVRHHAGGEVQGPRADPAAARHAALRCPTWPPASA